MSGRTQQIGDAVLHLLRGFIRERDAKDRLRRHAFLHQIGCAVSDHARLARARAGENEQGPVRVQDGLALAFVQLVEKGHGMRCLTDSIASISLRP